MKTSELSRLRKENAEYKKAFAKIAQALSRYNGDWVVHTVSRVIKSLPPK